MYIIISFHNKTLTAISNGLKLMLVVRWPSAVHLLHKMHPNDHRYITIVSCTKLQPTIWEIHDISWALTCPWIPSSLCTIFSASLEEARFCPLVYFSLACCAAFPHFPAGVLNKLADCGGGSACDISVILNPREVSAWYG